MLWGPSSPYRSDLRAHALPQFLPWVLGELLSSLPSLTSERSQSLLFPHRMSGLNAQNSHREGRMRFYHRLWPAAMLRQLFTYPDAVSPVMYSFTPSVDFY